VISNLTLTDRRETAMERGTRIHKEIENTMTTSQVTVVLTIKHHAEINPVRTVGAALASIRDAVDGVADDHEVELLVTDAAVGSVVYAGRGTP